MVASIATLHHGHFFLYAIICHGFKSIVLSINGAGTGTDVILLQCGQDISMREMSLVVKII